MAPRARILVVDDQEPFRRALVAVARSAGVGPVVHTASAAATLEVLSSGGEAPVLGLIDVNLGTESGIDLAARLVADYPEMTVVLVSTMDPRDLPRDAATCGASRFVRKSELGPSLLRELVEATTPTGV